MTRRLAMIGANALFVFSVGGCASPSTHFYTLSTQAEETPTPVPVSVSVGPVRIPVIVDRMEFVLSIGPNEVRPDEFNRWASPLRDNISRAVIGDLVRLLASGRITLTADRSVSVPDYRAAIEVQHFESVGGQGVNLDAVWTVTRMADGVIQTGRTTVHQAVQRNDPGALAAAHSRTIAMLSADIATAIRSLYGTAKS
jgi:uncharacterized lipoprotein YmbA